MAAVTAGAVYLYHYDASKGAPSQLNGLHYPGWALRTFFEVMGGVFGIHLSNGSGVTTNVEILFGVVLFLLAAYAVASRGVYRDASSGAPIGIALICFGLLYALGFAYGRAWAGPTTATGSQYTTFTILILVGTYLALLDPPVRSTALARSSVLRTATSALLVVILCLQVVLGTTSGLRVASTFHRQQEFAATVLVDLKQVPNPVMQDGLGSWWLPPNLVRSYATTLELRHLSVFDSGDVTALRHQALAERKAGAFNYTAPPLSLVLNPRIIQTVKGTVIIDLLIPGRSQPKGVDMHLLAGTDDVTLGPATQTAYGWIRYWDTTRVRNGTYQIQTFVHDERGVKRNVPVTVVVNNPM